MRISKDAADAFCAKPPKGVVAALVYGDAGAVADRCDRLRAAWCSGPDMQVERLSGEALRRDPAALDTALRSDGLFTAGRCLIIGNATDGAAQAFASVIDTASEKCRLIVTAGSLNAGSKLRKLFEKAPHAAAIQSYEAPLTDTDIAVLLRAAGGGEITGDALTTLRHVAETMDGAAFRSEVEKLVLYTEGREVGAADVAASCGAARATSLDAVLDAAIGGRPAELRHALAHAWIGGQAPDAAASAMARRLRTLRGALAISFGERCDVETALSRLSPPIRFPVNQAYARHASLWSVSSLDAALAQVMQAQTLIRSATAAPAAVIVERAMIRVAMLARR